MFKKYTAWAAAMMMAASMASASAQTTVCNQPDRLADWGINRPRQGCSATWTSDCGVKMGCDTTCGTSCATDGCSATTCGANCSTCLGCDTTCSPITGCNQPSAPTAAPQATPPSATPAPEATRAPEVQAPSTGDDYTTPSVSMQEQKMLNLLNQDRKNNGLAPLTLDAELSRIARIKSEDMRDNNYFAHQSPTWGSASDMLRRFGYAFSAAGENIAHHANVDKAQAAFMSSAGHRANILSSTWEKVGIGVCQDANGYIYATQLFVR